MSDPDDRGDAPDAATPSNLFGENFTPAPKTIKSGLLKNEPEDPDRILEWWEIAALPDDY